MYGQTTVMILTGVVRQFVAQASHKNEKGEYESWGVETAGAAAVAEQPEPSPSRPASGSGSED